MGTGSGQLTFRVPIVKGSLAPSPQQGIFLKWRMVTDPAEIDGAEEESTVDLETLAEIVPDGLVHGTAELESLGRHLMFRTSEVKFLLISWTDKHENLSRYLFYYKE
jgi:hypothetical protein